MEADGLLRFQEFKALIESGGDTPKQRLSFAYGVISMLLDSRAVLRAVADEREECIRVLEADLGAARVKLEMLTKSGKPTKARIRTIIGGVMAGLVMVSQITGYDIKDLTAPENPASALVVMVEPGDVPGWPTDPSEGTMPESEDVPPSIALWESDPGESKTVGGIRFKNGTTDTRFTVSSSKEPRRGFVQLQGNGRMDLSTVDGGVLTAENLTHGTVWIDWKEEAGFVFRGRAVGQVNTPIPPIPSGESMIVSGVIIANDTEDELTGEVSDGTIVGGRWFESGEQQKLLVVDRPGETVTVENTQSAGMCILLTVGPLQLIGGGESS